MRDYRDWQNNPFNSPDGYFNAYYGNPWWQIDQSRLDERSSDLVGSASLNFKPVDWINISYRASLGKNDYNNKAYVMNWNSYPFAKCGYSAFKAGQYTTIAGSEIETVGNLFFAGEHTSYNFQGYMNGGASTGRIAAQSILKILTKTNTRAPQLATVKESGRNYTGFN